VATAPLLPIVGTAPVAVSLGSHNPSFRACRGISSSYLPPWRRKHPHRQPNPPRSWTARHLLRRHLEQLKNSRRLRGLDLHRPAVQFQPQLTKSSGARRKKTLVRRPPRSTRAYIEFMRPRCVELARVLKKTGSFLLPLRLARLPTSKSCSTRFRGEQFRMRSCGNDERPQPAQTVTDQFTT